MSYHEAMQAAGASVLNFQCFGDYQGTWWAKVLFEGKTFWVKGYYGSCSGCDDFYAHFNSYEQNGCGEHCYEHTEDNSACPECISVKANYQERLSKFGLAYLTGGDITQEEAEMELQTVIEQGFDYGECKEQLEFVKANSI